MQPSAIFASCERTAPQLVNQTTPQPDYDPRLISSGNQTNPAIIREACFLHKCHGYVLDKTPQKVKRHKTRHRRNELQPKGALGLGPPAWRVKKKTYTCLPYLIQNTCSIAELK